MHFLMQDCVNLRKICQPGNVDGFGAVEVCPAQMQGARICAYLENMSDTISTSVSAAAIFSAEVGCGRPPPNKKDILEEECDK
jgi:hypothetical protein